MEAILRFVLLMIAFFYTTGVAAIDGDVDLTFGQNGYAFAGANFYNFGGTALAAQRDGKILICSTRRYDGGGAWGSGSGLRISRFSSDGSPDVTFGISGYVEFGSQGNWLSCSKITTSSSGKIFAVGVHMYDPTSQNAEIRVISFEPDGGLSQGFGFLGQLRVPEIIAENNSIEVQADGKVLISGIAPINANANGFAVVRLNVDGSYDASFNGSGVVTVGIPQVGASAYESAGIVLDRQGRIVVGGDSGLGQNDVAIAVTRLLSNGQLDTSFNGTGWTQIGPNFSATAMMIQNDGKIVIAGQRNDPFHQSAIFARFRENGAVDGTFGSGGVATIDSFGMDTDVLWISGISQLSDGALVGTGGYFYNIMTPPWLSSGLRTVVVRLNSNGILDQDFGNAHGVSYVPGLPCYRCELDQSSSGIALQGNQILISGSGWWKGQGAQLAFVARIQNTPYDSIFINGFE